MISEKFTSLNMSGTGGLTPDQIEELDRLRREQNPGKYDPDDDGRQQIQIEIDRRPQAPDYRPVRDNEDADRGVHHFNL